MRVVILILFLFPAFCIAQKEASKTSSADKPSTTDCPTWNKKEKKSKAAYFQSLRSTKTKANQQASSNPVNYRDTKVQSNAVPQKSEISNQKMNVKQVPEETNSEKVEIVKPKKKEKSNPVLSKKNKTDKSSTVSPEKSSIHTDEKSVATKVPLEEKKLIKDNLDTTKTNETKTGMKDTKPEDSKIKRKLDRMSRKTTKVRRHSNSKCPSF